MHKLRERFVVDDTGRATDVVMAVEDYERLKLRLAELEAFSARAAQGELHLGQIDTETHRRLKALFDTLSEDEIDQAEAGEGPYVWLIEVMEELGLARLADNVQADPDEFLPFDQAMTEIDQRPGQ